VTGQVQGAQECDDLGEGFPRGGEDDDGPAGGVTAAVPESERVLFELYEGLDARAELVLVLDKVEGRDLLSGQVEPSGGLEIDVDLLDLELRRASCSSRHHTMISRSGTERHPVPRLRGTFLSMDDLSVLDRINALLDADDESTVNTSMRLPVALRDAAALAVDQLQVAASTTTLTATALRAALETAVMEAALEAHYAQHPTARPTLAEVAQALAAQDGSPLADQRQLLEQAAAEVLARHPDADADDVLLWAEAQQAALRHTA